MSRPGGLGRGLASLIPQTKKNSQKNEEQSGTVNYFGRDDDYNTKKTTFSKKNNFDNEKKINLKSKHLNVNKNSKIVSNKNIIEISTDKITPNPYQPRKIFDESKLNELANSIKKYGILQPLVVNEKKEDVYELIAGERRLEASKIAGLEKIPAIIRKSNDEEKMELALIENIQRHNLNVIEEAKAYKKMQERFGLTQEEISQRIGKSRSAIANALRLLSLPIEIQRALLENKLTEGHARMILSVENSEKQRALFDLILKDNLSVRQTEAKVKEITISSHKRVMIEADPEIKEKEDILSNNLGTKVKIKKSKKGGQIVLDFYSNEELNNLVEGIVVGFKQV